LALAVEKSGKYRKGAVKMEIKQDIFEELAQSARRREKYAKWQCIFSILSAACCLVLLAAALYLLPQVNRITEKVQSLAGQAETVLTNLETVTQELSEVDFENVIANVDNLVTSSQSGVEEAMEKIDAIDIEGLNKGIKDLATAVEPLANLAKRFR